MIEPKKNIKEVFRTPPSFVKRIGRITRIDRNERTIPFPQKHLKKILNSISPEEVVAYPELEPFYGKLSGWLNVNREQVLIVSGSDTGIKAVYQVYVDEGDEVLMLSPAYAMYPVYCAMFGGVKKEIFYNDNFTLPVGKILKAISGKTKLVVMANPNYTGTVFKESDIVRIVKTARDSGAIVLVDEAYHHFYNGTMFPFIEQFDNLIIVRTLSKAFGIAPLRIGYLISNKDIVAHLYKVKLTHEITSVSAKFGEYLLGHLEIMEDYVRDIKKGKDYLAKEFEQLGIVSPKTHTNFVFAKLPPGIDGAEIVQLLKEKEFYVSGPFSIQPIKNCIRITVGPVEQMCKFIAVFRPIYEKVKAGCRV